MDKSMNHDFYFKQLLSHLFPDFIQLFFPEMFDYLDHASFVPLDKELLGNPDLQQVHLADLVMKAKFKHADEFCLVHVEIQSQPQSGFPHRFYKYCSKLEDKYNLPVYPIVIFAFDKSLKLQPSRYDRHFPDLDTLTFRYRSIQLNRLCWKDFHNILNPVAAALMAKMKLSGSSKASVKLRCLALLKEIDRDDNTNKLVSWFIDGYLILTLKEEKEYELLRDNLEPEVKEVVMKMETSWSRKGREEGLKEGLKAGLQQGREQGMATMLEKHLHIRLGDLPQESIIGIHKLNSPKLLDLYEASLTFRSTTDLQNWLNQHSP